MRWRRILPCLQHMLTVDGRVVQPLRQRVGAETLLQRLQLIRRQQAVARPVALEAPALVPSAAAVSDWSGRLFPSAAGRRQFSRHVYSWLVAPSILDVIRS